MALIERASEELARQVDRRRFMRRIAGAAFGLAATVATGKTLPQAALTSGCFCSPPGFGYCTYRNASYCNGAQCAGGCTFNTNYYPGACWTTITCNYGDGWCGYYACCDCWCYGSQCGCNTFVQSSC